MNEFENKVGTKELIPISHKDFNDFIKGKGLQEGIVTS